MLMPSPPIVQPWVVTRATTVAPSDEVTRMFASLVSTRTLAFRSRLKVLVHSSVEPEGRTDRSSIQIITIMSYLLWIADCLFAIPILKRSVTFRQSAIGIRQLRSFISQRDHRI